MWAPLSLGAFHLSPSAVLLLLLSLGAGGWSGSQALVQNVTVSDAPPFRVSYKAWMRMWYSVQGRKSVNRHSIEWPVKIDLYFPSLPLSDNSTYEWRQIGLWNTDDKHMKRNAGYIILFWLLAVWLRIVLQNVSNNAQSTPNYMCMCLILKSLFAECFYYGNKCFSQPWL